MKYDPGAWEKLGDKFTNNYEVGMLDYRKNIIDVILKLEHECDIILEIACADGWFIEKLRNNGFMNHYLGVDITPNLIDRARKRMLSESFDIMDATDMYLISDEEFSFVLCAGLLMHLPHYRKAILEACRTSNKYVLFSTYGTFERMGYSIQEETQRFVNNVYTIDDIVKFVPREFKLIEFKAFQRTSNFNIFQFLYARADFP